MEDPMITRSHVALACVLGTFAAFTVGCSGNVDSTSNDEPATIESALEAENGGLDTAPETPEFADPVIKAISNFGAKFADIKDMTSPALAQPGARSYTVAVFWGHLPAPRDAEATDVEPAPLSWNGSLSVDAGAIGLKKTIKFDDADQVLPRTEAKSLSFESRTMPHVDGMLLRVVVPASGSQTLHFDTAALKTDIDLSSLATKAGGAKRLDDGRNGMAFIGFPDVPGCARGFVVGRWNKVRPQLGTLRGHVADASGEPVGHYRGIWGHAPRKDKDLFFGKYIAKDGQHRGLFGGSYGAGSFQGVWGVKGTQGDANIGVVEGVYGDGYLKDDGRGVMLGRWSERCDAR
jgi:hypothetical protein